ncbi:hypothetical protein HPB49_001190 [Dermacentor silvarum]|uniref:Uncharacterized protein n=1 Tax=Dermacentor silvarum TaxID=543639 RepID=A0ACB8DHL9_DERSI|nr:uncharacterized protein LOC119432555 [Dermacentor silvarum]KAH7970220.1 hypothetical protein HPB49_001190 [Dermacentor silvarum]
MTPFFLSSSANKEYPPLLCSVNGKVELQYLKLLCTHFIFLSATVDTIKLVAQPIAGSEEAFAEFKKMKREFGNITKLVSFPVHEIGAIDMADIDKAFASIRGGLLDGIDIRYIQGTERSIHKLKELRSLADQKKYLIHGVFEKVNINVMRHFHLASLRAYAALSQGPYKAAPVQPSMNVQTTVTAYAAAVIDAKLESYGNHCIAFTLAPVGFLGARQLDDHAYGVKKYEYCTDYNQADAKRDAVDLSYHVRTNTALVVFDKAEDFANKVEKIGALPNACVLLDDVNYDNHNCSCDNKNFKLLRAARRVLWQTLRDKPAALESASLYRREPSFGTTSMIPTMPPNLD